MRERQTSTRERRGVELGVRERYIGRREGAKVGEDRVDRGTGKGEEEGGECRGGKGRGAHGSVFIVHGTRFAIHGSWFTVHDSQLTVHD